jgi:hypothetical protein
MDSRLDEVPPISTQMGEALIARLARVERQNETLRRMAMLVGLGAITALAISLLALSSSGFFSGSDGILVARGIVLRDANGVQRGTWQVADDGSTVLQLHDRNSVPRMKLSLLDTGAPGVALTDPRGRTRIVLGLLPAEGGTLAFADDDGNTRLVLGMAPDDATTLVFVDAQGMTRAGLGVSGTGDPSLTLLENAAPPPPDTTSQQQ